MSSDLERLMSGALWQRLMQVVWPAFLMAGAAELVFFAIFDPFELHFFGRTLDWSREAVYALGFFGFWGLGMASSALTLFLALSTPPSESASGAESRTTLQ